jgi:hypothetical protein
MPDVTIKAIDDMEAIYGSLARRARAELGVTAWGMQVFTLPADWDGYPNHNHSSDAFDPNQGEAAGDGRKLIHQLNESHAGLAAIAAILIGLHLAVTALAAALFPRTGDVGRLAAADPPA